MKIDLIVSFDNKINEEDFFGKIVDMSLLENSKNLLLNVPMTPSITKTRKRRTSKPKEQSTPILSKPSILPSVSSALIHTRGQINNEQPTIIQQIQAPPDPRIDKLEKRSLKIKEYMKGNKGESKTNPINVSSPAFQDAFETPSNARLISEKNVEPRKINFEKNCTQTKQYFFLIL